jgi:hypothetical protein
LKRERLLCDLPLLSLDHSKQGVSNIVVPAEQRPEREVPADLLSQRISDVPTEVVLLHVSDRTVAVEVQKRTLVAIAPLVPLQLSTQNLRITWYTRV